MPGGQGEEAAGAQAAGGASSWGENPKNLDETGISSAGPPDLVLRKTRVHLGAFRAAALALHFPLHPGRASRSPLETGHLGDSNLLCSPEPSGRAGMEVMPGKRRERHDLSPLRARTHARGSQAGAGKLQLEALGSSFLGNPRGTSKDAGFIGTLSAQSGSQAHSSSKW